ncbi:MAG: hypothetical protein PGN07_08970 [Aeromicrobium erythreum]
MTNHPVRLLLLVLAVVAGVVVARNVTADRGGSYDPAQAQR